MYGFSIEGSLVIFQRERAGWRVTILDSEAIADCGVVAGIPNRRYAQEILKLFQGKATR